MNFSLKVTWDKKWSPLIQGMLPQIQEMTLTILLHVTFFHVVLVLCGI